MTKDTRSRNNYFHGDVHQYLREYTGAMFNALTKIDSEELNRAHEKLRLTHSAGGRIFVGGNGGSAAIADHLCCDFSKGIQTNIYRGLPVHSLVGGHALFTAIANDLGYQKTFSYQLDLANFDGGDMLILISSSGNSPNIIEACNFAKSRGGLVIGLTGFDGGELRKLSNVKLHVNANNYGVIEDVHQAIMHILAQFHYLSLHGKR